LCLNPNPPERCPKSVCKSHPVLGLHQGDEDKVVPPEQAVLMHEALKKAGVPTALVMYKACGDGRTRLAVITHLGVEGMSWGFHTQMRVCPHVWGVAHVFEGPPSAYGMAHLS